jgi:uncharacterized protein
VTSPEERLDLVRRGWEAYNAGDVAAIGDLLDPGIEIYASEGLMNSGTYNGHDGYFRWVSAWDEAWEEFVNEPEQVVAVGERHVVARTRARGIGRGSGVGVEQTLGYCYEVEQGRAVYLALLPSFEEAMSMAREREGLEAEGKRTPVAGLDPERRITLVRRSFEAYEVGDLDALLELVDPEIVVNTPQELGNPGTYRGIDGFKQWLREWAEAWDEFHHEILEMVPVGTHHVVGHTRQMARGRGSGVEVEREVAYVYEIRNGRCVFLRLEPTLEAAMAVAGEREGLEGSAGS